MHGLSRYCSRLVNNMVVGVTEGFTKKLTLKGVGYRAIKGKAVSLTLGFSHPVEHELPEGIKAECPSQLKLLSLVAISS